MTDSDVLGIDTTVGMTVRYLPSDADEARANWGANENPAELLDPEQTYTVERVEVHKWHTKLWLADAGGPFNSTHFTEVREP